MSAGNQPIIIRKKKVSGHGGHHGGSWKVAYADFVTAMMAFFMVMWIMGLSEETRKSIQGYFNDPIGFMKNEPRSRSVIAISSAPTGKPTKGDRAYELEQRALEKTENEVKKEIAQAQQGLDELGKDVKIKLAEDGLEIELVEERGAVFFESGSAVIRPKAHQIVAHIAPILAASGHPLVVEGHTDAAPFAAPGGNFQLSSDRAASLMRALQANGVPESQFKEVIGYGATHLERPDAPFDFSNRRVTILIPRGEGGADKPRDEIKDRLTEAGGHPEALDLAPEPVTIKAQGQKGKE